MITAELYIGRYHVTSLHLRYEHPPPTVQISTLDQLSIEWKAEVEHKIAVFRMIRPSGYRTWDYALEDVV